MLETHTRKYRLDDGLNVEVELDGQQRPKAVSFSGAGQCGTVVDAQVLARVAAILHLAAYSQVCVEHGFHSDYPCGGCQPESAARAAGA